MDRYKNNSMVIFEDDFLIKKSFKRCILKFVKRGIVSQKSQSLIISNIFYGLNSKDYNEYSGLNYIMKLRMQKGDNRSVVFYGFDPLIFLKSKFGPSLFESPNIQYIQLPTKLSKFRDVIITLDKKKGCTTQLDSLLAYKALEGIELRLNHVIDNAITGLNLILLKADELSYDQKRVRWNKLFEAYNNNNIIKNILINYKQFHLENTMFYLKRKKSFTKQVEILKKANVLFLQMYKVLINNQFSEPLYKKVVYKGHETLKLLEQIKIKLGNEIENLKNRRY